MGVWGSGDEVVDGVLDRDRVVLLVPTTRVLVVRVALAADVKPEEPPVLVGKEAVPVLVMVPVIETVPDVVVALVAVRLEL